MRYSRLESVEEKKNFRNAVIFAALSIAVIVGIVTLGLPAMGRVATFVTGLKSGSAPIVSNDKTPPAPPNFNAYPSFTNQQTVSLTGTAAPAVTIKLNFNGSIQTTLTDNSGNFTFSNLNLQTGNNTFSAAALDSSGNISRQTPDNTIVYDTKPPSLNINSPSDGSSFFGSTQAQVAIQGTTDSGTGVTINDRIVSVADNGNFSYTTTLNSGSNQFKIIATDQAGNTTEKDISLNFSQ